MSSDPRVVRLLEDAKQSEKRGEFAEALDFYEEVVRLGAQTPDSLTAMGGCYMHTRQRQNARQAWLRAFEMNPNHKPAVDQLDRYFQGWEKTISSTAPHKASSPPPPPPAPSGGSHADRTKISLSFETVPPVDRTPPPPRTSIEETHITDEDIFGTPLQRPAPAPRPAPSRPAVDPFETTHPGRPARPRPGQRPVPAAAPSRASTLPGSQLPMVNWEFVMADAIVEAERRH